MYSQGMGPGQVGMGGNIYRLNRTLRRREGEKEGGFRMFKRNSPMKPDEKWYMLNILLCRQLNFLIKLTTARHQKNFLNPLPSCFPTLFSPFPPLLPQQPISPGRDLVPSSSSSSSSSSFFRAPNADVRGGLS